VKAAIVLARRVIRFELALYRSLFRWLTRRPDVPAGTVGFAYVGAVAALIWGFIFVSVIELVVLHLILPWEGVRTVVDILSIWGLLWMLGMLASLKVHPHLVTDSTLRIRHGASKDVPVPLDAIATIVVRERGRDRSRAVQLDRDERATVLNVVVASRTNVELTLRRPLVVALPKGEESVTAVRLYTDDPRGLVGRVRDHLTARDELTDEPVS
jgi:hypothetical protein